MKICFFFFLFVLSILQAQVDFGVKTGYNVSQHYGVKDEKDDYQVKSSFRHGITSGVFLSLPITERFSMQYEANYVQKGSNQIITVDIFEEKIPLDVIYKTNYVEFPILFNYSFPLSSKIHYKAVSGTAMSLLVNNYYQLDGIWQDEDGEVALTAKEDNFAMEQFDFSFLYGGELLYRWSDWNILVSYRFSIGWNSLKMPTYAYLPFAEGEELIDNPPVELKNQSYSITMGIIF